MSRTLQWAVRKTIRRLAPAVPFRKSFDLTDEVRALVKVGNEGAYPHKEIGETLVRRGDLGVVRETSEWLGEVYYTVEFEARAAVVAMRACELASASA